MANRSAAAHSYGGKRKYGLGWVPWAALLLLALIAALSYLVATNVTDENDAAGVDLADDEISQTAPTADDRNASVGAGNSPAAPPISTTISTIGADSGGMVGGGSIAPVAARSAEVKASTDAATAGTVLFAENSATLDARSQTVVNNAAAILRQENAQAVVVTGYTNVIGNRPVNSSLSQERAESVAVALRSQLDAGVRVTTSAEGEANPIAQNTNSDGSDNPQGRQMNRRAVIASS